MTPQGPPRRSYVILDSVGVIYFVASGGASLLVNVLQADGHLVLIPAEVRQEVETRMSTRRWNAAGL